MKKVCFWKTFENKTAIFRTTIWFGGQLFSSCLFVAPTAGPMFRDRRFGGSIGSSKVSAKIRHAFNWVIFPFYFQIICLVMSMLYKFPCKLSFPHKSSCMKLPQPKKKTTQQLVVSKRSSLGIRNGQARMSTTLGLFNIKDDLRIFTGSFRYLKWRYWTLFLPKNGGTKKGCVFPYISRIHTAYIGEDSSILGTLKCLVIFGSI